MGISTVRGAFSKVNGTVELDDQDITKSTVDVSHRRAHGGHARTRRATRICAAIIFLTWSISLP